MKSLWFFNNINIFKGSPPHRLGNYRTNYQLDSYNKQGYIYSIVEGVQRVCCVAKQEIKRFKKGCYRGVQELLNPVTTVIGNIISIETKVEKFTLSTPKTTFSCLVGVNTNYKLIHSNQTFSIRIYKATAFNLQEVQNLLSLFLFKDTQKRLKFFLQERCFHYGYVYKIVDYKIV